MTKHRKFSITTVDIIVVLSGIAVLLIMGYIPDPTIKTLFEAIGTSLIGAGFVTYLLRRFYSDEPDDMVKIVSDNRTILDSEYRQRKYKAHETDIVSIALSGALSELATDPTERMLKRIIFDRAKVRLLFLSPTAGYVKQRAMEDAVAVDELQDTLKESVVCCIKIFTRLNNLYTIASCNNTLQRDKMGTIEIRLIELCPHFTIYRTDNDILWGIYTSAHRGLFSPVLQVPKEQHMLYEQLIGHFNKLWDKNMTTPNGDNCLVRFYDPHVPTLNESLFTEVLGSDWKMKYLKPYPGKNKGL